MSVAEHEKNLSQNLLSKDSISLEGEQTIGIGGISAKPPLFKLTANDTINPVQKKPMLQSDTKEFTTLDTEKEIATGSEDKPGNNKASGPISFKAPVFQLKEDGTIIQREEADPVVTVVTIPQLKAELVEVEYDAPTYDDITRQLSDQKSAGDVTVTQESMDFKANPDNKTYTLVVKVKIVKHMPKWKQYDEIKQRISTEEDPKEKEYLTRVIKAWDSVYKSLDAHENHHVEDEKALYTKARTEIKGKKKSEAETYLNDLETKGKEISHEFHESAESAIMKWPIIERKPTKVP